jgi:hypothetical protein
VRDDLNRKKGGFRVGFGSGEAKSEALRDAMILYLLKQQDDGNEIEKKFMITPSGTSIETTFLYTPSGKFT